MNYARIIIGVYRIKKVVLNNNIQKQTGFTLIEILIVVILLGILATVIIPQVNVSSDDAKLNTLKTNLSHMRRVIELYYFQHGNNYPGAKRALNGDDVVNQSQSANSFFRQLTKYSEVTGNVSVTKTAAAKFGPYIKSDALPTNPYNSKNDVLCDITETDITVKASDGTTGWKFYIKTGILLANDGAHDDL